MPKPQAKAPFELFYTLFSPWPPIPNTELSYSLKDLPAWERGRNDTFTCAGIFSCTGVSGNSRALWNRNWRGWELTLKQRKMYTHPDWTRKRENVCTHPEGTEQIPATEGDHRLNADLCSCSYPEQHRWSFYCKSPIKIHSFLGFWFIPPTALTFQISRNHVPAVTNSQLSYLNITDLLGAVDSRKYSIIYFHTH